MNSSVEAPNLTVETKISDRGYLALHERIKTLTELQRELREERIAMMVFDGKVPALAAHAFLDEYNPVLYGNINTLEVVHGNH